MKLSMKKKIDNLINDNSTEFNYYIGSNESTNYTNYNRIALNNQVGMNKNITLNPYRNSEQSNNSLYKYENSVGLKNSK